jgi:hypothetical protein
MVDGRYRSGNHTEVLNRTSGLDGLTEISNQACVGFRCRGRDDKITLAGFSSECLLRRGGLSSAKVLTTPCGSILTNEHERRDRHSVLARTGGGLGTESRRELATIGLGRTVTESWKQQARPLTRADGATNRCKRCRSEMNLIVAVPALQEPRAARRAFQSVPKSVTEYYFRGDSASYDKQLCARCSDL